MRILEDYFGLHPGILGIEIVVLGGVDIATGSKREDRFRAIMRLIDYLHHHQTFVFLVLDKENYAHRLKAAAAKMKSIHTDRRYVTRPEYIRIWKRSFEFDNFSCTEIAAALGEVAEGRVRFTVKQVRAAREEKKTWCRPRSALSSRVRLRPAQDRAVRVPGSPNAVSSSPSKHREPTHRRRLGPNRGACRPQPPAHNPEDERRKPGVKISRPETPTTGKTTTTGILTLYAFRLSPGPTTTPR